MHNILYIIKPEYMARLLLLIGLCCMVSPAISADSLSIHIDEQTEINLEVYKGTSQILFIWQPHENGVQSIDRQIARQLSDAGITVWLTDLLESYFLSNTASSMDKVNGDGYFAILQEARKQHKIIILGASGRGAIPVLRGIHKWQTTSKDHSGLHGLVLLSPKLYVETPEPGKPASFMPIAEATNVPIYILQPDQSPWFWKLSDTIKALNKGGSDVYLKSLKKLRDRFYFRPDAFDYETQFSDRLWRELLNSILLFAKQPTHYRAPATLTDTSIVKRQPQDRFLQQYQGNPQPPALTLPGLDGNTLSLADLRGKVVLVNFWATWCPPCVHEMPSMQRLSDKLSDKPFSILAVNMAETEQDVRHFLETKVNVNFPIILDKDGKALKDWQVFAFPTSYVIDKQGKIRLALFGSVEWDQPEIYQPIIELINEQE